jgi:hypothetical protein
MKVGLEEKGACCSLHMRKYLWLQKLTGLFLHDVGDGHNLQLVRDR